MTRRDVTRIVLIASAGLVAMAGCSDPPQPDAPAVENRPFIKRNGKVLTPVMPGGKKVSRNAILGVQLAIISVEVPMGMASGSEEIWSYLDEEPVSVKQKGNLGRNGFRIGHGKKDSWPDVARALTRMTGQKLKETATLAFPGSPFPIVLKMLQPEQTIFTFFPDRTMTGADYPAGDNIVSLTCTLDEDEPGKVLLTGLPQIRSTQHHAEIISENGSLMIANRPYYFNFDEASFQIMTPSQDILVIGPGSQVRRKHSIGRSFLVKQKDGVDFETVIVIVPQVLAQDDAPTTKPSP